MKKSLLRFSLRLFAELAILCLFLVLVSCRTQRVVLPEVHTEFHRADALRIDSVYHAHYLFMKGDTVWMKDTVLKYEVIEKAVEVFIHDSIPYPVEVPIEVPAPIPKIYIWSTALFWASILIIFVALFVRSKNTRVNLIKKAASIFC